MYYFNIQDIVYHLRARIFSVVRTLPSDCRRVKLPCGDGEAVRVTWSGDSDLDEDGDADSSVVLSIPQLLALYFIYLIYPKYWDKLTPYHTCPKVWTTAFYLLLMCPKTTGCMANSVDLIRCCILRCLFWVYTVCSGISVPKLRAFFWQLFFLSFIFFFFIMVYMS